MKIKNLNQYGKDELRKRLEDKTFYRFFIINNIMLEPEVDIEQAFISGGCTQRSARNQQTRIKHVNTSALLRDIAWRRLNQNMSIKEAAHLYNVSEAFIQECWNASELVMETQDLEPTELKYLKAEYIDE